MPDNTTAIVWLRRDLRIDDNPALAYAAEHAERVLPVYIHAPDEEAPWQPGAASNWWLHHSLLALSDALKAAGSKLLIRSGPSLEALRKLIDETEATLVVWNRLYDPAVIARDKTVKTALGDDDIEAKSFNGYLLAEPWTVETKTGGPYKVYTPFWKSIRPRLDELHPAATPELPPAPRVKSEALDDLGLLPKLDWADGFHDHWTPGSAGAHDNLQRFLKEAVHRYPDGRNIPARQDTSRLSPHLHFGEISPREVLAATREHNAGDSRPGANIGAEKFLSELAWREFAHHLIYHFPETTEQPLNTRFEHFEWLWDTDALPAWQRGDTGIPIVDAGMRELWQTGWMHNRVRMIVGSLLTKNLRTHWLEGARWFWDTLVDANLANNTLGWQWIAGCGADAAPYFRIFNPVTQGEKFDADGDYVRRYVPELAARANKVLHGPTDTAIVDLKTSRHEALAAYDEVKG